MSSSVESPFALDRPSPETGAPVPAEDWMHEYDVVQLRFESLTFAYLCFFLTFGWFRLYWTLIRAGWLWASLVGGAIALVGTINAYRAWRKSRSFAALVALLLDGGLTLSISVPAVAFLLVYWIA